MKKRGLFFSLDTLFALGVAVLFFAALFYWLAQLDIRALGNTEMVHYSQSVASVMEQQGAFAQENISTFLGNYTKNETCFNVTVYSPAGILQYSALRAGCTNTTYPLVLSRGFISGNNSFYLARLEGWYDE